MTSLNTGRERLATILTIAVLAAALGIGLGRKTGWRVPNLRTLVFGSITAAPEPQDTVYSMLKAERSGDVKSYLANYSGGLELALKQSIAELGDATFAEYLVQSSAQVKGVSVSEPQRISESVVTVRVETIYADRNEAQTMYLEKGPGGWKISRTDNDERIRTPIPYGTAVR